MAHPDTHKKQAASLLKKGIISQKAHDRMLAKIAGMAPPPAPNGEGDPAMTAAVTPAPAADPSAMTPVPPGQGNLTNPQQPPAA